jgi:hypothetical protein
LNDGALVAGAVDAHRHVDVAGHRNLFRARGRARERAKCPHEEQASKENAGTGHRPFHASDRHGRSLQSAMTSR